MSEQYLSLSQLVELTGIPESSCKRYLNEHSEYMDFKTVHNRYRINVSAVETLKIVRRLYGEGHRKEEIDDYLQGSDIPVTITVDNTEKGTDLISINQEISEMKKMLNLQAQFNQKLVTDNQELMTEIQNVKTMLNNQESEKILQLRESLEVEKAAREEVEKKAREVYEKEAEKEASIKKGFFSRLFGG